MRRIVFSLFLTATFCLGSFGGAFGTAHAQGYAAPKEDSYVVSNINADASDESSVKARGKAFEQAQSDAFRQLASSLGSPMNSEVPLDSRAISGLVKDFEVKNEQISHKRYRGQFTFRFHKSAVNRFLGINTGYNNYSGQMQPTGYEEPQQTESALLGNKNLVLPFITDGKNSFIWDKDKNKFWAELKSKTSDASLIYPQGTILDTTDVWEKDPNLLSMSSINRIRTRYSVDKVLVTVMRRDPKSKNWMVDIYRTDHNRVEPIKTVPVMLAQPQISPAPSQGEEGDDSLIYSTAAATTLDAMERLQAESLQPPISETYAPDIPGIYTNERMEDTDTPSGSVYTQPYTRPYTLPVTPQVAQQPATSPAIQSPLPQNMDVTVTAGLTSLRDWTSLQTALRSNPVLSDYKILSLTTRAAKLQFPLADWQKGQADLIKSGYRIEKVIDGSYRIMQ